MQLFKIAVEDLKPGMYVSELDRPWLESPFLFQGFLLEDSKVIAEVRRECRWVKIDAEQSGVPVDELRRLAVAEDQEGAGSTAETVRRSLQARDDVKGYIDKALHDMRLGASVDTAPAAALVERVTESVVRDANVMLWFTNLRDLDEYTSIHCVNVSVLALAFGHSLGIGGDELKALGMGALLHDLGKAQVPSAVLNKPGPLDAEEWTEMKRHPVYGYERLRDAPGLSDLSLQIVHRHHERLDGTGYPGGLAEGDVSRLVRIAAIADVYDALTSDRCYKSGIPPHESLRHMYAGADRHFGKDLVEAFIVCVGIYPVGSLVTLTNGMVAVVTRANPGHRLKPVVLPVLDGEGKTIRKRRFLNLAHRTAGAEVAVRGVADPKALGVAVSAIIREEAPAL